MAVKTRLADETFLPVLVATANFPQVKALLLHVEMAAHRVAAGFPQVKAVPQDQQADLWIFPQAKAPGKPVIAMVQQSNKVVSASATPQQHKAVRDEAAQMNQ